MRAFWSSSERLPVCKLRGRSHRLAEHFDVDQINRKCHRYFEDVSLAPTSLRIDGLIKPFTDWDHLRRACIPVTDEQLLEVKRASHNFMRDANREYDRRMREVNKPTQSPINFAFTTNYDDDSVPKCPFYRTYLFPQEVSRLHASMQRPRTKAPQITN